MSTVPLSLLDFPGYLADDDGVPLAFGWLTFYAAGTTTLSDTFSDVLGTVANTNPLQLDTEGRYTVFLQPSLYDIVVSEFDVSTPTVPGAQLYTREGVGDPGQILASTSANVQAEGSKNVATGYTILSTDNLVTTATGAVAAVLQLPAAADRGTLLIVINYLSATCTLTPDGTETINGLAAALVIPAAASPVFHWAQLYSDGASAWYALTG
jgi:hypothetical protein